MLGIDQEHQEFQRTCRAFTNSHVRPVVKEAERAGQPPAELWRAMGSAGLLGLMTPEEYGGSGRDELAVAILAEELSRAAGGIAVGALVSAYMAGTHIVRYGDSEQRTQYSPAVAAGESIASIAVTEPEAGSDVAGISTRAVRDGDDYRLVGRKMFITNAGLADVFIIGAKTAPEQGYRGITTFLVPADTPGLSVGRPLSKLGWHSSDTRELIVDEVVVPATAILGELDRGFYQIMEAFQLERICLAAMAVGHAAECFDLARKHVRTRNAFGAKLIDKQSVRHRLAVMEIELDAARMLTYRAAHQLHTKDPDAARGVAKAKYYAATTACRIVDDAVQLHGGSGFLEESDVARHFRDIRVLRIGGGVDEVQLDILAKSYE